MRLTRRVRLAAGAAATVLASSAALAQISTDSSLGRAGQALTGPRFTIPESLGSLRGPNLFHSFSVFNIASGQSATFTTSTRGIGNVVSRVTGGSASTINGALALVAADGAPNFFFINPAGVTFGAGASIDVPGAFHVSTADYVKFPDGSFHADPGAPSTLSSAAPEAFGFLGANRGLVSVTGGARLTTGVLQPFSIVAGDISMNDGRATARGGEIRIVALGGRSGEVPFSGALPSGDGELSLVNGAQISASVTGATDGGRVGVSAGDILIDRQGSAGVTGILSQANSGTTGAAGVLDIHATGSVAIVNGGVISTSAFASGNAGSVSIEADEVVIDGAGAATTTGIFSNASTGSTGNAGSVNVRATQGVGVLNDGEISSSTFGAGTGGTLVVAAPALLVQNGGLIASSAHATGNAGSIRIDAAHVVIDGNAGASGATSIVSNAQSGTGNAGSIDINATGSLTIVNGGTILSHSFTAGDGGAITINAGNMLLDSMGHEEHVTTVASNTYGGTGDAGTISVKVPGTLAVMNGGEISSSTFSAGNARTVSVNAGNILIDAQDYTRWATGIFSVVDSGTGSAGTVNVAASGDILMRNGGNIASGTFSSGQAGEVHVSARNLTIDGQGRYTPISSNSDSSATGNAGRVQVDVVERLTILDEGFIGSSTFSSGNAGSVRVRAAEILIDGRTPGNNASISSQANEGTGNAGSVDVAASGSLTLLRNGVITSSTFSTGNAGPVSVTAGSIAIEGNAPAEFATGIISNAYEGSGDAGPVSVSAVGAIDIRAGGEISSSTYTAGNAGTIAIRAGSMRIDGGGDFAGVFSQAIEGTGDAGTISVTVAGALALVDRGQINSSTFAAGNAGTVRVSAADISLDHAGRPDGVTAIISQADRGSSGNAGSVEVDVSGRLSIFEGGSIASSTFGPGEAGSVVVRAHDLLVDGRNHNTSLTGIASQAEDGGSGNAGNIDVAVKESLVLRNGGAISSSTFSSGDGGRVTVTAGTALIDRQGASNPTGILSQAYFGSSGDAGTVIVDVREALDLLDGGVISSGTFGTGDAGAVRVRARDITAASPTTSQRAGIFSQAEEGSSGDGGTVDVAAMGTLTLRTEGFIASSTFGSGNAGSVTVEAGRLVIDGERFVTGIHSQAELGSTGNAGAIHVRVAGDLVMSARGQIASNTFAAGDAGPIRVEARDISIDGQGTTSVGSRATGTGIFSQAVYDSAGDAGNIDVVATGDILLTAGGLISSTTQADGNGGAVRVAANNITIDGARSFSDTGIYSRAEFGRGNAGTVDVNAAGDLRINEGGLITSDTYYDGQGGTVRVNAANITIVGGEFAFVTGIASRTTPTSTGNAGSVAVTAPGVLSVLNGGQITSSTSSRHGSAGSVDVRAGAIEVDGNVEFLGRSTITARAEPGSSGQTGNLMVTADRILLSNGGELSITNDADLSLLDRPDLVRPTTLSITAREIHLQSGGRVTAASSVNAPASHIGVEFGSLLALDTASITTSANDGDGGAIRIAGPGAIVLRDAQITTSVAGLNGNGGDIAIRAGGLVMDTGFIQANTAAQARGGDVSIDVDALIPSGNTLFVGGQASIEFQPGLFGLNVIQAAAPTGVSGEIAIATPALDVSSGLVGLNAKVIDTGGLGRSLCEMSGGSSLAQAGRGGMPPSARDFARVEAMAPTMPLALAALSGSATSWLPCRR